MFLSNGRDFTYPWVQPPTLRVPLRSNWKTPLWLWASCCQKASCPSPVPHSAPRLLPAQLLGWLELETQGSCYDGVSPYRVSALCTFSLFRLLEFPFIQKPMAPGSLWEPPFASLLLHLPTPDSCVTQVLMFVSCQTDFWSKQILVGYSSTNRVGDRVLFAHQESPGLINTF